MKTPEEIKKDAETCLNHPMHMACNCCHLFGECDGSAEHIIKELYGLVLQLESRIAQVERERDAAVACIQKMHEALEVKDGTIGSYRLNVSMALKAFTEWIMKCRGICPENTREE